jgi:predicted amidohydrolase
MDYLDIDLWAANLQFRCGSIEDWLGRVEERMSAAAGRGASILAMPEFACAQWLEFAPADLPQGEQLLWLARQVEPVLDRLAETSAATGVAILPGTIPHAGETKDGAPAIYNRAWFLTPEGDRHHQDKLSLTPLEAEGASGITLPGTRIKVFEWRDMRIAMPICLDTEYTQLWARLGSVDLDLVLIPAKTDMITGYARVFGCAHARAIELQTVVCVVGAVGAPLTPWQLDTGVGGAAVYLPCDVSVCVDGVWAALPAQAAQEAKDIALSATGIPVSQVRAIRNGKAEAEVRPAGWDAGHIEIVEPA